MKTFIVTRHIGMLEWVKSQDIHIDEHLTHLSSTQIFTKGDVVIGILPLHLIAELTNLGVVYLHVSITIDAAHRGLELSLDQLLMFNPRLEHFELLMHPVSSELRLKIACR